QCASGAIVIAGAVMASFAFIRPPYAVAASTATGPTTLSAGAVSRTSTGPCKGCASPLVGRPGRTGVPGQVRGRLRPPPDLQFREDGGHVVLDSLLRELQADADLTVRVALGHHGQDPLFLRRQSRQLLVPQQVLPL